MQKHLCGSENLKTRMDGAAQVGKLETRFQWFGHVLQR